jgi:hypothetical protein
MKLSGPLTYMTLPVGVSGTADRDLFALRRTRLRGLSSEYSSVGDLSICRGAIARGVRNPHGLIRALIRAQPI